MQEVTDPQLKEALRGVIPENLFGQMLVSEKKRTPLVRKITLDTMRRAMQDAPTRYC